MFVSGHIACEDRAGECVESGEQRCSVVLIVVGHLAGVNLLHGQAQQGSVERLDLALLIDGQDDGVDQRADIEADDGGKLFRKHRIV